jgi:hypothetical protein
MFKKTAEREEIFLIFTKEQSFILGRIFKNHDYS